LEWAQVEFGRSAALHVRRAKGGKASVHPIRGYELRMLTALRKAFPDNGYVFTTERRTPFTTDAINRPIKNVGNRAELPLPVHFHMLRHSCGYKLANDGIDTRAIQDWLGHVSITHTTRYAQLSPARLKDFWRQAANTMTAVLGPGPPSLSNGSISIGTRFPHPSSVPSATGCHLPGKR
jgi:type 1 fimbriae regulatory protein FimE